MDKIMDKISEFEVGDTCINILTGEKVKVVSLYRIDAGTYADNSFDGICAKLSNGDDTSKYEGNHPYCRKEEVFCRLE